VIVLRALGNFGGLAVNGHRHRGDLTDGALRDVFLNGLAGDGVHHHGHGLLGGQPVGVVVALREVAHVVGVAEQVGHGAELAQAAARCTQVLRVRPAVSQHMQQREAGPHGHGVQGAGRVGRGLGVPGDHEAPGGGRGRRRGRDPGGARVTRLASPARVALWSQVAVQAPESYWAGCPGPPVKARCSLEPRCAHGTRVSHEPGCARLTAEARLARTAGRPHGARPAGPAWHSQHAL